MATLSPPPYQDAADSSTWMSWYRQINDLLSGVSTSINNIDDVTITGAENNDFLVYDGSEWANETAAQAVESLGLDTGDAVTFASLTITGAIDAESYIDMPGIAEPGAPASGIARMYADTNNGFTRIGRINEQGVKREFTRDLFVIVRNMTGSPITAGTPVYINGANGLVPTIAAADAAARSTVADGILMQTVANTNYGEMMLDGLLTGLDTSSYSAAGVDLYLASGGGLTESIPANPNITQKVAVVTVKNPTVGELYVDTRAGLVNAEELGLDTADAVVFDTLDVETLTAEDIEGATALWTGNVDIEGTLTGPTVVGGTDAEFATGLFTGNLDVEGTLTGPTVVGGTDAEFATGLFTGNLDVEGELNIDGLPVSAGTEVGNADEDVLTWNGTSETWEPQAAAGGGSWTYGTQTATTSGTSVTLADDVNFSSATEVEILFNGVSTNTNNAAPIVRIGPTGGVVSSGYNSTAGYISGSAAFEEYISSGFQTLNNTGYGAATAFSGVLRLSRWDTSEHLWLMTAIFDFGSTGAISTAVGSITLAGELNDITLTTTGGTATFDAGEARYRYR